VSSTPRSLTFRVARTAAVLFQMLKIYATAQYIETTICITNSSAKLKSSPKRNTYMYTSSQHPRRFEKNRGG
jgi:hypothetical protein